MSEPLKNAPCRNGLCTHPFSIHWTSYDGEVYGCASGGSVNPCPCNGFLMRYQPSSNQAWPGHPTAPGVRRSILEQVIEDQS